MKKLLISAILCLGAANALLPAKQKTFADLSDDELLKILDEYEETTTAGVPTTTTFAPIQRTTKITTRLPPPVQPQGCGNPSWTGPRMGEELEFAPYGQYGWTVAVFNNFNNTYACAGSLIHPSVVLTVGHWFKDSSSWTVKAGIWNLHQAEPFPNQVRLVSEVLVHPKYARTRYDIALLFLKDPIEVKAPISFVCLPPSNAVTPPGTPCTATAWGYEKYQGTTQEQMKIVEELPIVGSRDCEEKLRPTVGVGFELHRSMLCAGGERNVDTCTRDGGGPLVCEYKDHPGRYYQAGIVAAGVQCGRTGLPSLYTDVANLRAWVDEHMIRRGYGTDTYTLKTNN